ncbi:MAG: hypothetical protein JW811_08000 [Clostridiales bacterium]|nr:hypothetical protein [Clostridiales bacterium]
MKRNCLVIILCLLLCIMAGASASIASLDEVLSPLLDGPDAVRMSVNLTAKTLMPFDDIRLDLINRILKHLQLNVLLENNAGDALAAFELLLGGDTLFEVTEQYSGGAYLLQTSLLKNRMLFSTQASPMDTLLASSEEEPVIDEESLDPNTSDVEEAFDMLAAVDEIRGCYRDLIDKTVPLTEKNTVSYSIENIGRGRISYVAKLTTGQSTELLSELRALISCGMDAEYREELSRVTFARGFTVALYQNADGEDISVYIRGTIVYPDGDRRSLKWQWSFTPDDVTQTFLYQVSREEGRRDTRNIDAILTRTGNQDGFALECETTANLRRGGMNELSTLTLDLAVGTGEIKTCSGSVTRVTSGTYNGDDLDEITTGVSVDLSLPQADSAAELTGTATYRQIKNDTVTTELELSFVQASVAVSDNAQSESTLVEISILPADPSAAGEAAQTPTETVEESQAVQPEFLVGTPPLGLYDYEIPLEMITINMDTTARRVHRSLMNEAAQRLAGNLITAILNLPAEDRELLSDGMTEMDYAVFLAILE